MAIFPLLSCMNSFQPPNYINLSGTWRKTGYPENWDYCTFNSNKIIQRFNKGAYYEVWQWEWQYSEDGQGIYVIPHMSPNSGNCAFTRNIALSGDTLLLSFDANYIGRYVPYATASDSNWNTVDAVDMNRVGSVFCELLDYKMFSFEAIEQQLYNQKCHAYGWYADSIDSLDFLAFRTISKAPDFIYFRPLVPKNAPVETFIWNFGDGNLPDSQMYPTHTYAQAGIFTVSLFVKYADGRTELAEKDDYIHMK